MPPCGRSWRLFRDRPARAPARSQRLIETLEADPVKVTAYYIELEQFIAWCMDDVYRLAKSGEDDERKMKLVALEYRARLVLERFRKRDAN